MHRTFKNPSVKILETLLKLDKGSNVDKVVLTSRKKIKEDCSICKRKTLSSNRFKLTSGAKDLNFNHLVQLDTLLTDCRAVFKWLRRPLISVPHHFCVINQQRKYGRQFKEYGRSFTSVLQTNLSPTKDVHILPNK